MEGKESAPDVGSRTSLSDCSFFHFCFLQKIKLRIVSTGTPLSPSRVILLGFCTRSPVLRKEYGANTVLSEIEIAVELRWVRDAAVSCASARSVLTSVSSSGIGNTPPRVR